MTDKKKSERSSENEAWKDMRDASNKAEMDSSEALQDDALTDVEPGTKLKTDLKCSSEEE